MPANPHSLMVKANDLRNLLKVVALELQNDEFLVFLGAFQL